MSLLSVIAYFRNLHGQLQTFTCILTGIEHTTVKVKARAVIVVGCGLHTGEDMFVAVIGESLAGVRQHVDYIVEPAEETAKDNVCTVN